MKTKNIKRIIFAVVLLSVIIVVFGWHKNHFFYGYIKTPSKIILHYYGEQKEVNKEWSPAIFDDVCNLIRYQMPDVASHNIISDSVINEVKKYAVEYIYDKPQSIKVYMYEENIEKVQYTEVLFGAGGEYEDCVYIKTTDNTYLFIGVLGDIKYLVENMF